MPNIRIAIRVATFLMVVSSGWSKQLGLPDILQQFGQAGIAGEFISLLGAAEFALALCLLFPGARRPASVVLALGYGWCAASLLSIGLTALGVFSACMVPLLCIAAFGLDRFYGRNAAPRDPMALGVRDERR